MSASDSEEPKKDDLPESTEETAESSAEQVKPEKVPEPESNSQESPEESGAEESSQEEVEVTREEGPAAEEAEPFEDAPATEQTSKVSEEGDEIVETNPEDPFSDDSEDDEDYEDYDYEDDHDPYEDGLPDAEHYENEDREDPFEAVATSIEENLDSGKKRLGSEGGEMSFLEHLEDLRGTIFKSLLAFVIIGGLMVPVIPYISDILQWPLVRAFGSHDMMAENLKTFRPFEVFTVFIQMIFFGALGLSLPFILYFVAQFVAPGLTDQEKHVLRPGLMGAFFLFIFGVSITYFIILPMALYFIIFFNDKLGFEQIWWAGEYYSMVVWMCLGVGALFQFPLVLVLLCYIGVLSSEILQNSRRLVVVIVLVVAALVTPGGDPVTLLFMATPLYGLFEASILVSRIVEKKQAAQLAKSEQD